MVFLSNFKNSFKAKLHFLLFSIILLTTGASASIAIVKSRIRCSTDLSHQVPTPHREKLAELLQRITGFTQLSFTPEGFLIVATDQYTEGSVTARDVLRQALATHAMLEIQDHSRSESVNFGQFEATILTRHDQPSFTQTRWDVRLDFDDFIQMSAPPEVRESFNEGFVFLHEVLHGLGKTDAKQFGQIGECEEVVNQMRHELGLVLRTQYHSERVTTTGNFHRQRLLFKRLISLGGKLSGKELYLYFLPGRKTRMMEIN